MLLIGKKGIPRGYLIVADILVNVVLRLTISDKMSDEQLEDGLKKLYKGMDRS